MPRENLEKIDFKNIKEITAQPQVEFEKLNEV